MMSMKPNNEGQSRGSFFGRQQEAIATALVLMVLLWVGFHQAMLPKNAVQVGTLGTGAVNGVLADVKEISRKPHAIGTVEHRRVRDYIVDRLRRFGLQPDAQSTFYVRQGRNMSAAAYVENVAARLPGSANEKAVLLVAHYDSVPSSLGASDDGVGVACLLETIAALKAGPPLRNDVIFLFSDGEEIGSFGAAAFVRDHPWVTQVGVVVNLEARGNTGPTIMFETSRPNGWLLTHVRKSIRPLWTNSLLYDVYRRLPNDTDLTVFEGAGYAGLNFAFVEGLPFYHTLADDVEHVDIRSVEMQFAYVLSLAREFGNSTFQHSETGDVAYFTLPGSYLVSYPLRWVSPLSLITVSTLVCVVILGIQRGRLKKGGILWGLGGFFLTLMLGSAASLTVWLFVRTLHQSYQVFILGRTYNSGLYEIAFGCLTVAIISSLYLWLRRKAADLDLWCGALLGCALLLLPATRYSPGGSYVLSVPLAFAALAMGIAVCSPATEKRFRWVILIVSAAPAVFLIVPLIYTFAEALPLAAFPMSAFLIVVLAAFLLPQLKVLVDPNRWWLPGISLLAFLACIFVSAITAGFTQYHPRPTNLFYAFDGDQNRAIWGSTNLVLDEWTKQFFPAATAHRGSIPDYVPDRQNQYLSAEAPLVDFAVPAAAKVSEEDDHGARMLNLAIRSMRAAPVMYIQISPLKRVFEMKLNGRALLVPKSSSGGAELICFALPPEGVTLTLRVSQDPIEIKLTDQSYELPGALLASKSQRPGDMIATQYPFNFYGDATFLRKSYTY